MVVVLIVVLGWLEVVVVPVLVVVVLVVMVVVVEVPTCLVAFLVSLTVFLPRPTTCSMTSANGGVR